MKRLTLAGGMLCAGGIVAFLIGCGGSQVPTAGPAATVFVQARHSKQFSYTGRAQYFKVPRGVTSIRVDATGAQGAGPTGGAGRRVVATLSVTPGENLAVFVGGAGADTSGGFNGGANGGFGPRSGGSGTGGGGAADLRDHGSALSDRILVAAGGGGSGGGHYGGSGGMGGMRTGAAGASGGAPLSDGGGGGGGAGGTQQSGGTGGAAGYSSYNYGAVGDNGSLGSGGAGGVGCVHSFCEGGGGGGAGGGYYGGGGGGSGTANSGSTYAGGGGGGGGSSYVEPHAKGIYSARAPRSVTRNGEVTISWQ